MIKIFGPANERFFAEASPDGKGMIRVENRPIETNARTFGGATKTYEDTHDASITPYDGSNPLVPFLDG